MEKRQKRKRDFIPQFECGVQENAMSPLITSYLKKQPHALILLFEEM